MPSNSIGVVGRLLLLMAFGAEAVAAMGTVLPETWI